MIESSHSEASLGFKFDSTKDSYDDNLDFSEQMFLAETEYADASYTFFDFKGLEIDIKTFSEMNDDEKLSCRVIRQDGTVVNQSNYDYSPLYGAV